MEGLILEKKKTKEIQLSQSSQDFLSSYRDRGPEADIRINLEKFIDSKKNQTQDTFEVVGTPENLELSKKVSDFLENNFSQELRSKLSITEVSLETDIVWVRVPATEKNSAYDTYVPSDAFAERLDQLEESEAKLLKSYVRRAVSHVAYNSLHPKLQNRKEAFKTPIYLYNQEFDIQNNKIKTGKIDEAGLDYLAESENFQESYLLGSVAHEVGHHIFENIVLNNKDLLEGFVESITQKDETTEYASGFDVKENPYLGYHERFAELIRLYTTAPEYLKKNNFQLYEKVDGIMNIIS